jgi:3'(2'),5'-bisphosphate nucleotidase
LLDALVVAAIEAGRAILDIARGDVGLRHKADASPVTAADAAAEAILTEALIAAYGDVPIVAEEAAAAGHLPADLGRRFFLVDPLDGTREFLAGNGEYTVNVALIEDGRPVVGVVHAPALGEIFEGRVGDGAWAGRIAADGTIERRPIAVRRHARPTPVVLASRSHCGAETEALLAALGPHDRIAAGSSLKFARLAAGEADLYPRLGRTMEWDTAAGEAVLAAAGGTVVGLDGRPLVYGGADRGFSNPWFMAYGDPELGRRATMAARRIRPA